MPATEVDERGESTAVASRALICRRRPFIYEAMLGIQMKIGK